MDLRMIEEMPLVVDVGSSQHHGQFHSKEILCFKTADTAQTIPIDGSLLSVIQRVIISKSREDRKRRPSSLQSDPWNTCVYRWPDNNSDYYQFTRAQLATPG